MGRATIIALPYCLKKGQENELRIKYITNSIRMISENTGRSVEGGKSYMKEFDELIHPAPDIDVDKLVSDIIEAAGLEAISE